MRRGYAGHNVLCGTEGQVSEGGRPVRRVVEDIIGRLLELWKSSVLFNLVGVLDFYVCK